jgi:hypothetical protein
VDAVMIEHRNRMLRGIAFSRANCRTIVES